MNNIDETSEDRLGELWAEHGREIPMSAQAAPSAML